MRKYGDLVGLIIVENYKSPCIYGIEYRCGHLFVALLNVSSNFIPILEFS